MRNVLLIGYEFPPSAGGGVQRLAKFARYLPDSGWQPTVLCAEPAWGRPTDDSLLDEIGDIEVVRLPARHVAANIGRVTAVAKAARSILRRRTGGGTSGGGMPGAKASGSPLSTRLMRRFFIDSAEPWARSVLPEARRLHERIGFDAVLASGPPPSALIAAARVARALDLPLVADFRDAWATSPDFRRPGNRRLDDRLTAGERDVLSVASAALVVSDPIGAEVAEYGAREVVVVPNGFDSSDLPAHASRPGPLRIIFMGRFYGVTDPTPFIDGAAAAVKSDPACADLVIEVFGQASDSIRAAFESRGLADHVVFHGFRPHAETLAAVAAADVGLVTLADHPGAEANYTGKLFEYLGIGVPVLLVGPAEGVAARLIREASAGAVAPYGDVDAVAAVISTFAAAKAASRPLASRDASKIARFERREQAAQVARALDKAVAGAARG